MITFRSFLAAVGIATAAVACQGAAAVSTAYVTTTSTATRPTGEPVTDRAVKRAAQDHFDAWGSRDFGAVYDQWTRQGRERTGLSRKAYARLMTACFPETAHLRVVKVTRSDGLAVVRGESAGGAYREYSVLYQDGEWRIVQRAQSLRYVEQCQQRS